MVDEATFLAESRTKATSGAEYVAQLEQFREYIDRAREMHPYARAAFYETLIDFCIDTIKGMGWDKPPAKAKAPEEDEPIPEPRHERHATTHASPRRK